ncbi:MAG: DUF456 domain-containing protein [Tenuifilaceae bacterium]
MDYFLLVVASILIITGLIGCILPILPGPPLSFGGLLLLYFTRFGHFDSSILIWTGIFSLIVTILDLVLPVWTTKKLGGTKRGVWGATIGLIIGIFILPPIGIIAGPFFGALIGEMTSKEKSGKALQSAIGSFLGFLLGTGLKLTVSGVITYYFVVESFLR